MQRIDTRLTITDKEIVARIAEYQKSLSDTVGLNLQINNVLRSLIMIGLSQVHQTEQNTVSDFLSDSA